MINDVEATLDRLYTRVWNDYLDTDQPTEIYHYTSVEGLCGIVTKGLFFASDLFCLQDPSEFQYGKSLLMEVLNDRSDVVSESLFKNLSQHPLFPHAGKNWSVYSISFCGTPDLLPQWRGYGGVGGYAIGARLTALLGHPQDFTVLRMLYDPEKQRHVFDKLTSEATQIFERYKKPGFEDELLTQIGLRLIQSIFNVKHPAYRGEDEWRIILLEAYDSVKHPVRYRVSGARIVPYVELKLERDWVSRILLGPTAYPNEHAITRMLATTGFASAKCEPSAIPFRP